MRIHSYAECLLGTFHKVAATSAVYVHLNAARYYNASPGVNQLDTFKRQIGINYVDNLVAVYQDGTLLQPTLRSKDTSINNLFHSLLYF